MQEVYNYMIRGLFIFLVILLGSCKKTEDIENKSITKIIPVNSFIVERLNVIPGKPPMFDPGNFNHDELFFIPISYYAPVSDNSQVLLRLLIPTIYHPDFGISQITTLNITSCDSFKMDGEYLKFYSQTTSQITSVPNQPGTGIDYFTDQTMVMLVYEDSTLAIIPNNLYGGGWLEVPEKNITAFYFLVTPYLVN